MNTPTILPFMNPNTHFIPPGSIAFVPASIILLMTIIAFAILYPKFFGTKNIKNPASSALITPSLLAFIVGSLMPLFDDLITFIFGIPFAHHSLFHSFIGVALTYILFLLISKPIYAKYAVAGNLYHIFFNLCLNYTTPFFPFTYHEFGLSDIIGVSTYMIKATLYPIIFLLFTLVIFKFFHQQKLE